MNYLPQSKALTKTIVIDANIAAAAVIPISGLEIVKDLFTRWAEENRSIYAPEWWLAEVISVLRQNVYRKLISLTGAKEAVEGIFALEVETIRIDIPLCQSALDWAEAINHSKVYDAIYLALSERLGAEFWTADKKLANAAKATGAQWVYWVGDAGE